MVQAAMSERCRDVARHAQKRKAHKGVLRILSAPAEGAEEDAQPAAAAQQPKQPPAAALKSVRERGKATPMDWQQTNVGGGTKRGKRRRR